MVGVGPMTALTARWHRSIAEISSQQWMELLGDDVLPFYEWEWLYALESSGSTVPDQGWQPLHLPGQVVTQPQPSTTVQGLTRRATRIVRGEA